jgi:hypothetical protein
MDLSKAFDCLPHEILLCKLSPKSVELLRNYLTGRKQQIKLQGFLSSWADIQKGGTSCIQLNLNQSINTELSFPSTLHQLISHNYHIFPRTVGNTGK